MAFKKTQTTREGGLTVENAYNRIEVMPYRRYGKGQLQVIVCAFADESKTTNLHKPFFKEKHVFSVGEIANPKDHDREAIPELRSEDKLDDEGNVVEEGKVTREAVEAYFAPRVPEINWSGDLYAQGYELLKMIPGYEDIPEI